MAIDINDGKISLNQVKYHWFWGIRLTKRIEPNNLMDQVYILSDNDVSTIRQKQTAIASRSIVSRFFFWIFNISNYARDLYLLQAVDRRNKSLDLEMKDLAKQNEFHQLQSNLNDANKMISNLTTEVVNLANEFKQCKERVADLESQIKTLKDRETQTNHIESSRLSLTQALALFEFNKLPTLLELEAKYKSLVQVHSTGDKNTEAFIRLQKAHRCLLSEISKDSGSLGEYVKETDVSSLTEAERQITQSENRLKRSISRNEALSRTLTFASPKDASPKTVPSPGMFVSPNRTSNNSHASVPNVKNFDQLLNESEALLVSLLHKTSP